MASKPILFSTPMVQAILDDRKTHTRRIVKPKRNSRCRMSLFNAIAHISGKWFGVDFDNMPFVNDLIEQPKYQPGDILWVRETWLKADDGFYYKADVKAPSESEDMRKAYGYKWKPSIFMPRDAARIFLKVTNVRVERLQEITEEDAIAEGISWLDEACYSNNGWTPTLYDPDSGGSPVFRDGFTALWDSINAKRGYGWGTNPWVWVYEFERVSEDED